IFTRAELLNLRKPCFGFQKILKKIQILVHLNYYICLKLIPNLGTNKTELMEKLSTGNNIFTLCDIFNVQYINYNYFADKTNKAFLNSLGNRDAFFLEGFTQLFDLLSGATLDPSRMKLDLWCLIWEEEEGCDVLMMIYMLGNVWIQFERSWQVHHHLPSDRDRQPKINNFLISRP
ncbi:hypothetical protein ACJX0J_011231, partial [Zea mays]